MQVGGVKKENTPTPPKEKNPFSIPSYCVIVLVIHRLSTGYPQLFDIKPVILLGTGQRHSERGVFVCIDFFNEFC